PGKSPVDTRTKMQTQTIAQKIQNAQRELNILRDSANELMAKEEMDADETKHYEELTAKAENTRIDIERYRRAERAFFNDDNTNGRDGEIIAPSQPDRLQLPPMLPAVQRTPEGKLF